MKLHKKKVKSKSLYIVYLGLFLLLFGAYRYFSVRILSFNKPPSGVSQTMAANKPVEIIIPDLKIDIPVEEKSISNGVWQVSERSVSHLDTSAGLGEGGNIVIYGHNKKIIFGSLPYLAIGAKINVKAANNQIYKYIVVSKETVDPERVDLVSPGNAEELTLYTCTGFFDNKRVVIKAKPLMVDPQVSISFLEKSK